MPLMYWAWTFIMRGGLLVLSRWRVVGRENVPQQGPLIVVSNHMSFIDPPLLSASLSRRICFMAKQELFRSLPMRLFVGSFGAFPIRRGHNPREGLKQCQAMLARGLALGMFPEGSRSRDGHLRQAQRGTALLALSSGAPILPMAISGSERVHGFWDVFRRPAITVAIGSPFYLAATQGKVSGRGLQPLADSIMEHIAQLLPESYRGFYGQNQSSQAKEHGD